MPSMNKTQLKAELKKYDLVEGKDYPKGAESSVEDLEKLLAKAEKDQEKLDEAEEVELTDEEKEENMPVEEEEAEEEEETEEEEDGPAEAPKKERKLGPQLRKNAFKYSGEGPIDIIRGNRYIRTFHEEAHGKEFKELAQSFMDKNTDPKTKKCPFTMTNTENVTELFVDYEKIDKKGKIQKIRKNFKGSIADKEKACQLAAEENKSIIFVQ